MGAGSGGGAGSLLTGRGTAGALVRSTIMFAGIFFVTSLALTTIANRTSDNRTEVERALGADDQDGGAGEPADLLDPTAPLFDDEAPAGAAEPEAAPGELVDPTAELPAETLPAEEPAEAPAETDNPQ